MQLPFAVTLDAQPGPQAASTETLRSGCLCPKCGKVLLDYNGVLELECPVCGYRISGGGGCT